MTAKRQTLSKPSSSENNRSSLLRILPSGQARCRLAVVHQAWELNQRHRSSLMNITIRSVEPADAEALWKCFTAPKVVRNTLQLPFRSLESMRQHLARLGEGDYQ